MTTENTPSTGLPATDLISQISYHHHQASLKAAEAIFHAKEAGRLLIEVKASLAHGEFGKWMQDNLKVSPRQAQRYMQTAQGKKPDQVEEAKAKNDTMSHFPAKKQKKAKPPLWTPREGFAYSGVWDGASYSVDPVKGKAGHFYVGMLKNERTSIEDGDVQISEDTEFQGAEIPANQVEATLQGFGMAEPGKLFWSVRKSEGLTQPWGCFGSEVVPFLTKDPLLMDFE